MAQLHIRERVAAFGRTTLLAAALPSSAAAQGENVVWAERETHLMGTRLRVAVAAPSKAAVGFEAIEAAFDEVRAMEGVLSSWREDSELGCLNAATVGVAYFPTTQLLSLLVEVSRWSVLSDGAFDPAVGALIDAWDLRGEGRRPTPSQLSRARAISGLAGFQIDEGDGYVIRRHDGSWITAGGFGKGAALRAARRALRDVGIERAMLDFGGQLLVMGAPESGASWEITVAHPSRRREAAFELRLRDRSVATSAASERFVLAEGERQGHILDPRTGYPARAWGSVTVVAEDPLIADVASTALFVMGPEAGLAWAEGRGDIAALFLVEDDERVGAMWTAAMEPWLSDGAQEAAAQDSAAIAELQRQIEAITREIEELKLGREVVVEADEGAYGLGPAASKVYRVRQGVSLAGYGEILYERFSNERQDGMPSGKTDQIDFLRGIIYVGYKFDDRFLFNSEIEIEHATTGQTGSVSFEFAYVDWLALDPLGFRAGLLLLPMGFINEQHEPTTFLGTERPETEQRIIPTTWRENGVGFFGEAGGVAYRGFVVSGLDAIGDGSSQAAGFSAGGLRGGRQKGSKAVAEGFAAVGRLDYVGRPGLNVGTSFYVGDSGQGNESSLTPGETITATTIIWEGHAEYRARGLWLRGLASLAHVDDADEINAARGLTGDESVGERLVGWYVQAGYDVLRRARTAHQLIPYVRFEQVNTQETVPEGFSVNPATDEQIVSLGVAWKPLTNLVVKGDYQFRTNAADTGVNQLNAAIGYLF